MIDWTDGFLSTIDRAHIQEEIDGNRDLPDRYRHRIQETVRHALSDFCLVTWWDEFDTHEALFGDLPEDKRDPEDWSDDVLETVVRSACPFIFYYDAVGREGFERVIELGLGLSPDVEGSVEVSIELDEE